jgi:hypothetical protein
MAISRASTRATSLTVDGVFTGTYDLDTAALAKADVGLGNVDNTSDVNKPVSTATQAAIDALGLLNPPAVATGQYFYPISSLSVSTSNSLGVGNLRLTPWLLTTTQAIDRLGTFITAAGETGAKYRVVIYSDTGNGYPNALLVDSGQLAADAIAGVYGTVSATLTRGLYWIGGVVQAVVTTQPTVATVSGWNPAVTFGVGTSAPASGQSALGFSSTGVTGTPPSTFPTGQGVVGATPRPICRAG